MFKVKVYTVGKTKEPWLEEAISIYTKRLTGTVSFEWVLSKDDAQLKQQLKKEHAYICLDPQGKSLSSLQFAEFIQKEFQASGSRLAFVIGGAEGLSPNVRAKASFQISLSPLTFTHQLARLILIEQLYRALQIAKGTPYHK